MSVPWPSRRGRRGSPRRTTALIHSATARRGTRLRHAAPLRCERLEPRHVLANAGPDFLANRVSDISPAANTGPALITPFGDAAYFVVDDGVTGEELWRSEGTSSTTVRVADIRPGPESSHPRELTVMGAFVYFVATEDGTTFSLWRSHGTTGDTVKIPNTTGTFDKRPRSLTAVDETLFFTQEDAHGRELWTLRQPGDVTERIDINTVRYVTPGPPVPNWGSNPEFLTNVNGTLYFAASDGEGGSGKWLGTRGVELWKSGGTRETTAIVRDIQGFHGFPTSQNLGSYPRDLQAVGGSLFFTAERGDPILAPTREVWKTDGSEATTVPVPRPPLGQAGGGTWVWHDDTGIWSGSETSPDLIAGGLRATGWTASTDDFLFFTARNGSSGNELWRTDGTAPGTVRLTDLISGAGDSNPENLVAVAGRVFFRFSATSTRRELWVSDGTVGGTKVVDGIGLDAIQNDAGWIAAADDRLYLRGKDPDKGAELWIVQREPHRWNVDSAAFQSPTSWQLGTAPDRTNPVRFDRPGQSTVQLLEDARVESVKVVQGDVRLLLRTPAARTLNAKRLDIEPAASLSLGLPGDQSAASPAERGKIDIRDRLTVEGSLQVHAGARLEVGSLDQASTATLEVTLGAGLRLQEDYKTGHPFAIKVRDSTTLAGQLNLRFEQGFVPEIGGHYGILVGKMNQLKGRFDKVSNVRVPGRDDRFMAVNYRYFLGADNTMMVAVEALCVEAPRLLGGGYLAPGPAVPSDFVLLVHGTASNSGVLRPVAEEVKRVADFRQTNGGSKGTGIDIALLDWGYFAGRGTLAGTESTAFNRIPVFFDPGGAATNALNIGRGLVQWLAEIDRNTYSRAHILGHSAAAWLAHSVVEEMAKWTGRSSIESHLTLFDAFVPDPSAVSILELLGVWDPRDGYLGTQHLGMSASFFDHYYHAADFPWTEARLPAALNVDVSVGRTRVPGESFGGWAAGHSWPYGWYVANSPLRATAASHAGMGLTLAFAHTGQVPRHDGVLARGAQVLEIGGDGIVRKKSVTDGPPLVDLAPKVQGKVGDVTIDAGTATLRTRSPAALTLAMTPQAGVNALSFDYAFPGDARGTLEVAVDGTAIWQVDSGDIAGLSTAFNSGLLELPPFSGTGTQNITFTLNNTTPAQVVSAVSNLRVAPLYRAIAPDAPTGVSATPGGDRSLALTWQPPNNDGGAPIIDYLIDFRLDGAAEWTTLQRPPAPQLSAVVPNLAVGKEYVFRVRAVNLAGTGPASSPSAAVRSLGVPDAPASLSGSATATDVVLAWEPPASDGGAAVTHYEIRYDRKVNGIWSGWRVWDRVAATGRTATISGLPSGHEYAFTIAAVNAVGRGAEARLSPNLFLAGATADSAGWAILLPPGAYPRDATNGAMPSLRTRVASRPDGSAEVVLQADTTVRGGSWRRESSLITVASDGTITRTLAFPDVTLNDVAVFDDGSSIIGGSFRQDSITVGATTLWNHSVAAPADSGFVARVNADGSIAWAVGVPMSSGKDDFSRVETVAVAPDGSAYVAGVFRGEMRLGETALTGPSYPGKSFLAKLHADGSFAWGQSLAFESGGLAIAARPNGGVVVAQSKDRWLGGGGITTYSASGDVVSSTAFGSPMAEGVFAEKRSISPRAIAISSTGAVAVTGMTERQELASNGSLTSVERAFAAVFDGAGRIVWDTPVVGSPAAVSILPDGSVLVGTSVANGDAADGASLSSSGPRDIVVEKRSSDGSAVWLRQMGGAGIDEVHDLGLAGDGSILLAGRFGGAISFGPIPLRGDGEGGFLARLDGNGLLIRGRPAAPTNLRVEALPGQATLRWDTPPGQGGVGISDYRVRWRENVGGQWSPWKQLERRPSPLTTAAVEGMVSGREYAFEVAAVSVVGPGDPVVLDAFTFPPGRTATVPDEPGGAAVVSRGRTSIALEWGRPAANGAPITDYRIRYAKKEANAALVWQTFPRAPSTVAGAVVTGLAEGQEYAFTVAAVNAVGTGPESQPLLAATSTDRFVDVLVEESLKPGVVEVIAVTAEESLTREQTPPGHIGLAWPTNGDMAFISSAAELANGARVVAGRLAGAWAFGDARITSAGARDIFVTRATASGGYDWALRAGGTADDDIGDMIVLADGAVVIAGTFQGEARFGETLLTSEGDSDIFLARISPAGAFEWAIRAGGAGRDRFQSMISNLYDSPWVGQGRRTALAAMPDGSFAVTGLVFGSVGIGGGTVGSADRETAFVATVTAQGHFKWVTAAGGTGNVSVNGISAHSDGTVFVTGGFTGTVTLGGSRLTSDATLSSRRPDILVAKLTSQGEWAWAMRGGGYVDDVGYGVQATADGGVIVTGQGGVNGELSIPDYQQSFRIGTTSLIGPGFVAKLNSTGAISWASRSHWALRDCTTLADGTIVAIADRDPAGAERGSGVESLLTYWTADGLFLRAAEFAPTDDRIPLAAFDQFASVKRSPFPIHGLTATPDGGALLVASFRKIYPSSNGDAGTRGSVLAKVPGLPAAAPEPTALNAVVDRVVGAVTLTWTPSPRSPTREVLGYEVQRFGKAKNFFEAWFREELADGTRTGVVLTGLERGTSPLLRVVPITKDGYGRPSAPIRVHIPAALPAAPQDLRAVNGDRQVTLSWRHPDSSFRILYRAKEAGRWGEWQPSNAPVEWTWQTKTAVLDGLVNGREYEFSVAAESAAGLGPATRLEKQVVVGTPSAVTGVSAIHADGRLKLTWNPPAADGGAPITDYEIRYDMVVDGAWGGWKTWQRPASTATTATFEGIVPGREYAFTVAARNANGTSREVWHVSRSAWNLIDVQAASQRSSISADSTVFVARSGEVSWDPRSFVITKTLSDGTQAWAVTVRSGDAGSVTCHRVQAIGDGGVIIALSFKDSVTLGSRAIASQGWSDNVVARLDAAGNFVWVTHLASDDVDSISDMATLPSGDILLFGALGNAGIVGLPMITRQSEFVASISLSGIVTWAAAAPWGYQQLLRVLADGSSVTRAGNTVTKFSASGNVEWTTSIEAPWWSGSVEIGRGGGTTLFGNNAAMEVLDDGSVVVAGTFSGSVQFGGTALVSRNGTKDIFVAKIDPVGRFAWAVRAGGPGDDAASAVAVRPDGSIVVAATFHGRAGPERGAQFGTSSLVVDRHSDDVPNAWGVPTLNNRNECVFVLDGKGTFVATLTDDTWRHAFRGPGIEIYDLAALPDGSTVVSGGFGGTVRFGDQELRGGSETEHYTTPFVARLGPTNRFERATAAVGSSSYRVVPSPDAALPEGLLNSLVGSLREPMPPGRMDEPSLEVVDGRVDVRWFAGDGIPLVDTVEKLTGYLIEYRAVGSQSWSRVERSSSFGNSMTLSGLAPGASYVFRVAPVTAVGSGAFSPESAAATIIAPAATPGSPKNVAGTPDNARVNLTWTAPTNDGGSAIADYVIQFKTTTATTWNTFSDGTSTNTSATVTGLENGTAYVFRVAAVNSAGTGTASAASASVTPRTVPAAPTSLVGTPGNTQVNLTWTAPVSTGGATITDYVIQYSSNLGSTWTTFNDGTSTSTSVTITGLANGTGYVFRVAAVNSVGTGSYSPNSSSISPRAVPDALLQVERIEMPPGRAYRAGDVLSFTVVTTRPVTVAGGTPTINVFAGTGLKSAVYASGSGTNTLVFRYVVAAGHNASSVILGRTINLPVGTTIRDAALQNLPRSIPGGVVSGATVDTAAPAVPLLALGFGVAGGATRAEATQAAGIATVKGENAAAVTVIFVGSTNGKQDPAKSVAKVVSGKGLAIAVPVALADADLLKLGDGPLFISARQADVAGNRSGAASIQARLDTTAPTIVGVVAPATKRYVAGTMLRFTVTFSENVIVTGKPFLELAFDGGVKRRATYFAGSGKRSLVFQYRLQPGDSAQNGPTMTPFISLSGGAIGDAASNAAILSFSPPKLTGIVIGAAAVKAAAFARL